MDAVSLARLLHLGWFRPVRCKSVSAQEVRAVLGARKAIKQSMIALEMPMRGLLRIFGLKVGAISRGRYERRIRELADGNPMLETATGPMLRARASLRQELAGLERLVRQMAQGVQYAGDFLQESWRVGRYDTIAQPVGRTRLIGRHHEGGRR